MNNLMVFENKKVEILNLNGVILFNPYHVGACLGLVDGAVRKAMLGMNEKQAKLILNSDVTNSNIRKLNNAGEKFLTESGLYKLIFKSRKPEAERFTDWVTDEVLPQIRKTSRYEAPKSTSLVPTVSMPMVGGKRPKNGSMLRVYTLNTGLKVVTVPDIARFAGVSKELVKYHQRKIGEYGILLMGHELTLFKAQNDVSPFISAIKVHSLPVAEKILRSMGYEVDLDKKDALRTPLPLGEPRGIKGREYQGFTYPLTRGEYVRNALQSFNFSVMLCLAGGGNQTELSRRMSAGILETAERIVERLQRE